MNSKAFDLKKLAADIYNEVYGDIDSKQVHAEKETEILDWLISGNLYDDTTLESLVADWREYDSMPDGMADPAGWKMKYEVVVRHGHPDLGEWVSVRKPFDTFEAAQKAAEKYRNENPDDGSGWNRSVGVRCPDGQIIR